MQSSGNNSGTHPEENLPDTNPRSKLLEGFPFCDSQEFEGVRILVNPTKKKTVRQLTREEVDEQTASLLGHGDFFQSFQNSN